MKYTIFPPPYLPSVIRPFSACSTKSTRQRCVFPFLFEESDDAVWNRRCAKNQEVIILRSAIYFPPLATTLLNSELGGAKLLKDSLYSIISFEFKLPHFLLNSTSRYHSQSQQLQNKAFLQ